jgi:glucokinase
VPPATALGIDFGGTKIALGVAGPDGQPSAVKRLPTQPDQGAAQAVERTLAAARELIDTTGADPVAVGVVSPGVVAPTSIALAPNVPGWGDLALADAIRGGLGIDTVVVGNDANAATVAEVRWGALRGVDPGLLISLGTGVAAGIAIGGRVVEGAHGAAGEIGYFSFGAGPAVAQGHAPLEERVGGRALLERGGVSAEELFASDDPAERALVDEALAELAVHVANIATLLDPQRIAVGGGLMGTPERVLGALGARVREATPFPPEIVAAQFAADGPLRGAIALALDVIDRRRERP